MRLIAAAFNDETAAEAARAGLTFAYGDNAAGLKVAPLGQASDPSGPAAILAGRFADDLAETVAADVVDLGGTVVVDMDERRAAS